MTELRENFTGLWGEPLTRDVLHALIHDPQTTFDRLAPSRLLEH